MSKLSKTVISAMIVIVIALAFTGGFLFGQAHGPINVTGLDIIDQAWHIILSNYVDPTKIDTSNLSRGAIEGMVETLDDPYTSYLTNEELIELSSSLQGEYTGIGALVTMRDGNVTIVTPFMGSPAEEVLEAGRYLTLPVRFGMVEARRRCGHPVKRAVCLPGYRRCADSQIRRVASAKESSRRFAAM